MVRQVDHRLYFDSSEQAATAQEWGQSNGFGVTYDEVDVTDGGQYRVRLHHHGTLALADITRRSIALDRYAREVGGEYDGWEAPVQAGQRGSADR